MEYLPDTIKQVRKKMEEQGVSLTSWMPLPDLTLTMRMMMDEYLMRGGTYTQRQLELRETCNSVVLPELERQHCYYLGSV